MRVKSSLVRLGIALTLAGGGVGALAAGPATPALGFVSGGLVLEVTIESPATLVARGAAVDVPVDVVCTSSQADLNVQVTERVGSDIASGFGFTEVTCTGSSQTVIVNVTDFSAKAFKQGTALTEADLFGCLDGFCGQQSASQVIKIVKPHK
jgi:hypothetical protein